MKLGPALTFYAKYPQELEALYVDEPNYKELIPEIKDEQINEVSEMVNAIANQAETDCKRFLAAAMDRIENTFFGQCKFLRVNKRSGWEASGYLCKPRGNPAKSNAMYGLEVYTVSDKLAVVGWLWVKGGRYKEENLARIISGDTKTAKSMNWSSRGCICLYQFSIAPSDDELDLDANPILDNAIDLVPKLSAKQIDEIFRLARQ